MVPLLDRVIGVPMAGLMQQMDGSTRYGRGVAA